MPDVALQLYAILRSSAANDCWLGTSLLFPEVTACASNRTRVLKDVESGVRHVLQDLPPIERHRRVISEPPTLHEIHIPLRPAAKSVTWLTAYRSAFSYVVWRRDGGRRIAYVPELDLYVLPRVDKDLESALQQQIELELGRRKALTSFSMLLSFQRFMSLEVVPFALEMEFPTPKQVLLAEREEKTESVLVKLATRFSRTPPRVFEMDCTAERIAMCLTARRPGSVLLVGPSGVGKTASVQLLAGQAVRWQLSDRGFWTTSGSKMISGAAGFGMWEDRVRNLCAELRKTGAVLHVGDLFELVESGKGGASSQGVGEFLRPYLERGEILLIAECTPATRTLIERENPGLLNAFTEIEFTEPASETALEILSQSFAKERREQRLAPEAIAETESLHRRFATYSVAPGRPLRFLRNLVSDSAPTAPTAPIGPKEVIAAFSRETGLPVNLLDDTAPLDIQESRTWFASRVIGQPAAVDVVMDLLATVKAGLSRPHRPLASLLFIGPSGVGKTEMAKTLAEYFYRDRSRLIRIDASEYADALSVERLTGGLDGAEGVLTSKVRDQPFGVVLLDEFEKAHPQFFDLLLQVLGEGRLTDNKENFADFCNAVVIMTSNLGAEARRKGSVGFHRGGPHESLLQEESVRHVQQFLRPEMFNRIDAIVPFDALDEASLLKIADREVRMAARRPGFRGRRIDPRIPDDVAAELSQRGFEPRYGARPLKRCIERELLLPVAAELNCVPATEPVDVEVALEPGVSESARPALAVRVRRTLPQDGSRSSSKELDRVVEFRRRVLRAEASPALLDLKNEVYRLERAEERYLKQVRRKKAATFDQRLAAKLGVLRPLLQRFRQILEHVCELEEAILLDRYANRETSSAVQSDRVTQLEAEERAWQELALDLFERQFPDGKANHLLMAIYHEAPGRMEKVVQLYTSLAESQQYQVQSWELRRCLGGVEHELPPGRFRVGEAVNGSPEGTVLEAHPLTREQLDEERHVDAVGVLLGMHGRLAYPFFEVESGLHRLKASQSPDVQWLIDIADCPPADYRPPAGVERRDPFATLRPRREYRDWQELDDDEFGGRVAISKTVAATLRQLLHRRFLQQAEALLEP